MTRKRAVILGSLALGFLALLLSVLQAKAGSSSIKVISTIHNFTGDTLPPNGTAYSTQGDDYTMATPFSYSGPGSNVTNDQWNLLLGDVKGAVHLTFVPVNGSSDSSKLDGLYNNALLHSRCFDAQGNIVPLPNIPPGTSNNTCFFVISFQFARTTYDFSMGPGTPDATTTGPAQVTCNTTTGTTCNNWTITPYSGGTNSGVAALRTLAGTLVGYYQNTYRIDVVP